MGLPCSDVALADTSELGGGHHVLITNHQLRDVDRMEAANRQTRQSQKVLPISTFPCLHLASVTKSCMISLSPLFALATGTLTSLNPTNDVPS